MVSQQEAARAVIEAQVLVNDQRRRNEKWVVESLVSRGLFLGYTVSVFDGDIWPIQQSDSLSAVMAELFHCDTNTLVFHTPGGRKLRVFLVYGNGDGFEVICDYSSLAEPLVEWVDDQIFRRNNR